MNDLSMTDWIANIPNTSVGAALNTPSVLPADISPSEVLHQFALGYRKAQEAANGESTGPTYLNVTSPIIFGTSLAKDELGDYRTVTHRFTVRQYLDANNINVNSGTTII
jgi:hypothetical protein